MLLPGMPPSLLEVSEDSDIIDPSHLRMVEQTPPVQSAWGTATSGWWTKLLRCRVRGETSMFVLLSTAVCGQLCVVGCGRGRDDNECWRMVSMGGCEPSCFRHDVIICSGTEGLPERGPQWTGRLGIWAQVLSFLVQALLLCHVLPAEGNTLSHSFLVSLSHFFLSVWQLHIYW